MKDCFPNACSHPDSSWSNSAPGTGGVVYILQSSANAEVN